MDTKRMTARDALRTARATMECGDLSNVAMTAGPCLFRDADKGLEYEMRWRETAGPYHACAASALLDGFSVEEVTNAGG